MTKEIKFEIIHDTPPKWIYEACQKKFGADFFKGTVFTYDNKIYSLKDVLGDLLAHEIVHLDQQKRYGSADKWWKEYLKNPVFRIEQEVEAYQNQWKWAEENGNRQYRKALKKHIINTLSGKLYGNVLTKDEAEELVFF